MSLFRFIRPLCLFLASALFVASPCLAVAQQASSPGTNTGNLLQQLAVAFSGGQVIHQAQLTGTATWHAGRLEDSGTVSLTASTDGTSQMQLVLGATGAKSETQSGLGLDANCQWSGADGVTHQVAQGNCWKPAVWFLPALSLLQPSLPDYPGVSDLGTGTVGSGTTVYRHLQSHSDGSRFSSRIAADITQQSTTDVGLDPVTLLPAVLTYAVHPDNGAQVPIAIEVRYSDYRAVNGAQIPFHIQRYVNNSLQLDILVESAQVN
jgi:hypothetical protein